MLREILETGWSILLTLEGITEIIGIIILPELEIKLLSINQPFLLSVSYSKKWEQDKILIGSEKSIGLNSLNVAALISDFDERKEIYIWAMAQKVKLNIMENRSIKNLIQLKIIKIQRTLLEIQLC